MHVSIEAHGNRAQTDNHNSLADAADPAESPVRSRRDHPPRRGRRMPGTTAPARTPPRAAAVLTALVLTAAICNLTLAGATVALPQIATDFNASQTTLNLIALGTGLGMAMTVLYAGAIADRYGRVRVLCIGLIALLVTGTAAALAPSAETLMAARVLTGMAAGMAFPTTLALITALWTDGAARGRAIALWTAICAGATVGGSILSGALVDTVGWRIALGAPVPLALVALVLAARTVPSYASALHVASDNPAYADRIIEAARISFVDGAWAAYLVGGIAIALGFLVVLLGLPSPAEERRLRERYAREDAPVA